jgi:NADPH-dependent 2,4-dienoyl-CoA reductase/sulfur reductase-like enzyme
MMSELTFVIIGGGQTAASAIEELRSQGFTGTVHLVGSERHVPYDRPSLSKKYLDGSIELDAVLLHPHTWYDENDVTTHFGVTATSIDTGANFVRLANGDSIGYNKALIATGSTARLSDLPGADLPGVHYLRTLDDGKALHGELAGGDKRVVVIGSSWIAMEVAASARSLGNEVTVVGRAKIPLANALGDTLGSLIADLHREHGVAMRMGAKVERIAETDGRASAVRLAGGEVLPADLVVFGLGATPNVAVARESGLNVHDGIVVDDSLQASSDDVYAAGDVASAYHPVLDQQLRSEHWANAVHQGAAAARAMLGLEVSYDDIPYFYTDQFEFHMEYSGYASLIEGTTLVYRGHMETLAFIVFWVTAENRVVAGMNVNVWDVNEQVQNLIRRGTPVDIVALADSAIPLADL